MSESKHVTITTPFQRMIKQQRDCREEVIGYAVGLASERTVRAAYMTGKGTEITNDEAKAAILPKKEAVALMMRFTKHEGTLDAEHFKIAFLVPVSHNLPLNRCTSSGF